MNRVLGLVAVFSLAGAIRAADEPKPNTLTPKEIADGWILLFDGETTFGWEPRTTESDRKPDLVVRDGALVFTRYNTFARLTTRFRYFTIRFEYRTEGEKGDAPSTDADFNVHTPSDGKVPGLSIGLGFGKPGEKGWGRAEAQFTPGGYTLLRQDDSSRKASEFKAELKKQYGLSALTFSPPHIKDSKLFLRNVKLRPLDTKPLFNGKDLTGWKKYTGDEKRAKSEFSVNKDGELTMKTGPGDLQTEGQWADFALQIECKTNGKRLNSGVFFRCIAGEYQNGYEAQIHNGWADKEKEYTIDDYDPKTNKLKGNHKVKSHAMDYGTGAIYRRIPARKEVAKDNEWFTMTIVAEGRHIATWVNGVQVVDWIDNRPLNKNPRNGCRLEKGPISLQGHDPTTDLNFRNIRLAELK
jgi:hypothetical protein